MNEDSASEMFIYLVIFGVPTILLGYYFVIVTRDYIKKWLKK